MRFIKGAGALLMGLALVACGGGKSSTSDGTTPTTSVSSVSVVASSSQVGTAGGTVTLTAVVQGTGNVGLASTAVSFAADTGSLTNASATTDASGVATATFSAGTDKTNRTATITVTAGGVSGTVTIEITGTKITYSGPNTLQFGGTATMSLKLTDSSGAAISNATVSVASSLGNGLSATSVTTDAQGSASVTYTANVSGSDTVTFSAVGASVTPTVVISGEDFSITAPASGATIALGASQTISARYLVGGLPASGPYAIRFATTAGTLAPAAALTGITLTSGVASASVSSTFAGPASIQATLINTSTNAVLAQTSVPVQFVATVPDHLTVQITPTAIGTNAAGSTAKQAQVRATVYDINNNPVQGAIVNFTKDADPSGGTLSQASTSTDPNGQATVQFISGATPTSADAVRIRATVAGTNITGVATLTVNQSALFIALGTGNDISNLAGSNGTVYVKSWTIYITDATGAPVPNQQVTVSLLPNRYRKGSFALVGDDYVYGTWDGVTLTTDGDLPQGAYLTCANEDTDYSGVVTGAKDVNSSGKLEPGNVITFTSGQNVTTVTTDGNGFAYVDIKYAESYASWVEVVLKASATVSGTESSNQSIFWVVGMKSDFSKGGGPPAGLFSPFGQKPSCTVAN